MSVSITNCFDLWSGLDTRHLSAFEAVAATRSIARAAQRLGYTQPAVSHQIATLERLAGARLFERGSGRGEATLTEAGHVFAGHAAALGSRLAAARADLDAIAHQQRPLRVGAFQSVSARILPELVHRLANEAPVIRLELTETTDEAQLLTSLEKGALDFSFVLLPLHDHRFESIKLLDDPWHLVASAASG